MRYLSNGEISFISGAGEACCAMGSAHYGYVYGDIPGSPVVKTDSTVACCSQGYAHYGYVRGNKIIKDPVVSHDIMMACCARGYAL